MPDTVRLLPALQTLLADNAAGDISPQDVRDFLVSVYRDYIKFSDLKADTVNGGTFTSGAWRTRNINTEDADAGGHASVAANQITLAAGDYVAMISCPAFFIESHQARLQNITDGATILLGTSEANDNATPAWATTRSFIVGQFALAASKVVEVQHRCQTTRAGDGFGPAGSFGVGEVYTIAEFWWRTP